MFGHDFTRLFSSFCVCYMCYLPVEKLDDSGSGRAAQKNTLDRPMFRQHAFQQTRKRGPHARFGLELDNYFDSCFIFC